MERIYLIVETSSQEPFNPLIIKKKSLEEAVRIFSEHIQERDDEYWKKKLIDLRISGENELYEAKLLVNRKGWGYDYIVGLKIESINLSLIK